MIRIFFVVIVLVIASSTCWAGEDRAAAAKGHLAFIKENSLPIIEVQEGFFGNKDRKIVDTLLAEIEIYLDLYRDIPTVGEILYLRSALLSDQKEYEGQAIALLKLIFEYPDSAFVELAKNDLADLSIKKLKDDGDMLNEIASSVVTGDQSERFAAFILAINRFNSNDYRPWILQEYREFQKRDPEYTSIDQAIVFSAALLAAEQDYRSAVYYYSKVINLYPNSRFRVLSYLEMGKTLSDKLKSYDAALEAYKQVYSDYPDSDGVISAYQLSALIYEDKLKKYPASIEKYEAIVAKFPKQEVTLAALNSIGRIYNTQMKQYVPSIEAYTRIADMYAGTPAVEALTEARSIAGGSLKDYRLLVELCRRQVTEYPDREESAEALYELAETHEKHLNDLQIALNTYREVAEKFPNSNLAGKAMKRVDKLLQ